MSEHAVVPGYEWDSEAQEDIGPFCRICGRFAYEADDDWVHIFGEGPFGEPHPSKSGVFGPEWGSNR